MTYDLFTRVQANTLRDLGLAQGVIPATPLEEVVLP